MVALSNIRGALCVLNAAVWLTPAGVPCSNAAKIQECKTWTQSEFCTYRLRSCLSFGAPQQISTGFASWLCYCSDVAQRKPTKLCTNINFARCLAVSWAGTLYIVFRGFLPRNGILPGATFTLRPSLALSYFGSDTARHSSSGCQPNFAALSRGRHLYSAGRPSQWALTHILVRRNVTRFRRSCQCARDFLD